MPLQVVEATTEQELHEMNSIEFAAFFQPNNSLALALNPAGVTPGLVEWADWRALKDMREKKNRYWLLIVDSVSKEPLCSAKWTFHEANEPKEPDDHSYPPGANIECTDAFMGMVEGARERIMGRKSYWHLNVLATYPQHERKGAGALALKWGTDRADAAGLETFLDATYIGRPMYEKYGFAAASEQDLDLRPFGVDKTYHSATMVRPPKA